MQASFHTVKIRGLLEYVYTDFWEYVIIAKV